MKLTLYIKDSGSVFKSMMYLNNYDRLADIIHNRDELMKFYNLIQFSPILMQRWDSNEIFDEFYLSENEFFEIVNNADLYSENNIEIKLQIGFGKPKHKFEIEVTSDSKHSFSTKVLCDKEPLTQEEYLSITRNHRGFVFIRGSWVSVNPDFFKKYHNANYDLNTLINDESICDKIVFNENDSKMQLDIKFCEKFKNHQIEAINKISNAFSMNRNILLADDMGLGKTATTIGLVNGLLNHESKPVLIVVPKSLVGNWISEFNNFAPNVDCEELRFGIPRLNGKVYISTYGNLLHHKEIINNTLWSIVILDEAQQIKNYKTKIAKLICSCNSYHRIALTGTPIENSVKDLWSIFQFLNPNLLGDLKQFEENMKTPYKFDNLIKLLSPFVIRRMKTDLKNLNLPNKNEIKVFVELSDYEKLLYNSIIDRFEYEKTVNRTTILKYLNNLKITCGMASNIFETDLIPSKLLKLRELVINSNYDKFVIFTQYVETADKICKFLKDVYKRDGIVINGNLSAIQRTQIANDFQNGKYPFIVLTLKSGNCGLTLTESCNLVHYDRWWNPSVENQATDRIYRIGQKRDCNIYKFIANNSIETEIDNILDDKNRLFDNVVNIFIENKNLLERI